MFCRLPRTTEGLCSLCRYPIGFVVPFIMWKAWNPKNGCLEVNRLANGFCVLGSIGAVEVESF